MWALFLLACAKLYWLMENDYLVYFATLLAPAADRHFRVVGSVFGVLGTAHALQLFTHIVVSIIAGRPAVYRLRFGSACSFPIRLIVNILAPSTAFDRIAKFSRDYHDSDVYDVTFGFRKLVEIVTQVFQSYRYSKMIARPWINHTKVAVVVANCCCGFIIQRLLLKRRQIALTSVSVADTVRLSGLVADVLLTTASSIIIPSLIILPYMLEFDVKSLNFPDSILYGEIAFSNLVHENRAFFAISWTNAIIKGVPHLSAFLCLLAIASALGSSQIGSAVSPSFTTGLWSKRKTLGAPPLTIPKSRRRSTKQVFYIAAQYLFLAIAVIVLAIHLSAQFRRKAGDIKAMQSLCLQHMHPWLSPNFSCSVIKYNCYKQDEDTPSVRSLNSLDREALHSIIFMHCSAFTMPPIIREFPFLLGIELWNATLENWGQNAALSAQLHVELISLIFVHVNLTAVPVGILQDPMPRRLIDIEFSHSNLTAIPEEVLPTWNNIQILYIEHSQLNAFPSTLLQIPVISELSLIDNNIDTVPEDVLLASTYLYELSLSRNPLKALPKKVNKDLVIFYLALEFTQLEALPSWTDEAVWQALSLGGSPLCADHDEDQQPRVHCGRGPDGWDPLGNERYPTELVTPHRLLEG